MQRKKTMTHDEKEIQDLRDWSARLVGINLPTKEVPDGFYNQYELGGWINTATNEVYPEEVILRSYNCTNSKGEKIPDWRPDSEDAPAWQILSVIERMRDRFWKLVVVGDRLMFEGSAGGKRTNWFTYTPKDFSPPYFGQPRLHGWWNENGTD